MAIGVLLVTVCAALLSGCGTPQATSGSAKAEPNVLRVGVTPTLPPMIFKQGHTFVGIEADLARQLAADLGKTPQLVELPWEKQIDALLEGRIDIIMSSMSVTPARAMRVDFTQPYMQSGQAALVRRSQAMEMRLFMYRPECRVGAQEATTGQYFVQQEMPRAKRSTFSNPRAGAEALVDKRIDVFIHDAPVTWWLASEYEAKGLTMIPALLTQESLAWAVRKDNTSLRDAANQFLEKVRQNKELQGVIKRWIPQWN